MDVDSATAMFFGGDEAKLQDYLAYLSFRDSLTGLTNPNRISDVIASGLDQYDAVFVPGGHGPMIDRLDGCDAGTVLRHFHKTSKPTAVLCHGPISLLAARPNASEAVGALGIGVNEMTHDRFAADVCCDQPAESHGPAGAQAASPAS
jgi:putative intracellular protease/amidase